MFIKMFFFQTRTTFGQIDNFFGIILSTDLNRNFKDQFLSYKLINSTKNNSP